MKYVVDERNEVDEHDNLSQLLHWRTSNLKFCSAELHGHFSIA